MVEIAETEYLSVLDKDLHGQRLQEVQLRRVPLYDGSVSLKYYPLSFISPRLLQYNTIQYNCPPCKVQKPGNH